MISKAFLLEKHNLPRKDLIYTIVPDWSKILGDVHKGPCVYAIFLKDELLYIGTTQNFYVRIKKHFASANELFSETLISNYQSLRYEILHNKKSYSVEREFIKLYQPKFNKDAK